MGLIEYHQGQKFPGVAGRTADESSPAWLVPKRAAKDTPNVLFIVLDDTGFGQLGCFGSPIETPNLDAIAANGLRYNNMHTTALCSPSRSCIITGRNHHSNNMACVTEFATGFPGYDGNVPFENGFLSEILLGEGFNTYMVGKWHLIPSSQESGAGPYDRWPLGRGFERFYGFLGGDTSQWHPDLVYDNHQVDPPATPEQGYHLTPDLVDKAVGFVADAKQVDPDKPFYLHFCPGATHAPHHVPKEWADKYAGKFDDGWDAYRERTFARQKELGIVPADCELSRHDPDVPDWDSLSDDQRRLYAREMEVFAGFLSHTDHHIGRLIEFLRTIDQLDNTLIMVVSDNGASAEGGVTGTTNEARFFNNVPGSVDDDLTVIDELGGPKHFNHYPWGWTFAGNTPFRRWKRETYRGGSSDPFLMQWPARIKSGGEIRTQYAHVIDMVPTVLDLLGFESPATIKGVPQSPIQGVSFAHTIDDAAAETNHHTQYFEMIGHRSIYHDGWRAVCPWPGPSFEEASVAFGAPISADTLSQLDATGWELYHVDEDFAETKNVAADHRDRLIGLIGTWYAEAGKYNVLPVDGSALERLLVERPLLALPARPVRVLPRHPVHPVLRGTERAEPPAQHHRRRRDPRRRRRGGADLPGRGARRLLPLREGRPAPLRPQLRRRRLLHGEVGRPDPVGSPRAPLRVRTDRRAERVRGQGCARAVPALRRRHPGRRDRRPLHDPHGPEPGGAHLRRQPGRAHHARLHGPVPVHRHDPHRHRRRQRRPGRRHRRPDARGHGPPVAQRHRSPAGRSPVSGDAAGREAIDNPNKAPHRRTQHHDQGDPPWQTSNSCSRSSPTSRPPTPRPRR